MKKQVSAENPHILPLALKYFTFVLKILKVYYIGHILMWTVIYLKHFIYFSVILLLKK